MQASLNSKGSARGLFPTLVGWAALVAVLTALLPPTEIALILGATMLASGGATLLWAARGHGHRAGWSLMRPLTGFAGLAAFVLLLHWEGHLPFFRGETFAVLCYLASTLILVLLRYGDDLRRAEGAFAPWLPLFWSLAILAAGTLAEPRGDTALAAMVLVNLVVLSLRLSGAEAPVRASQPGALATRLAQHGDLVLLPLFFAAPAVLSYLLARLLSLAVAACLDAMIARAREPLGAAYRKEAPQTFAAVAARLNLATLLVGGGAALCALTLAPYLGDWVHPAGNALAPILPWLLLAAICPSLFGAQEVILATVGRVDWLIRLSWGALAVLMALAASGFVRTPQDLAMAFALTRVAQSALAALLLVRVAGVWPGPTALLLRRIKLF